MKIKKSSWNHPAQLPEPDPLKGCAMAVVWFTIIILCVLWLIFIE